MTDGLVVQDRQSGKMSKPTRNDLRRIFESNRSVDERKLLRWPIEVWVSCGEQFIAPAVPPSSTSEALSTRRQQQQQKQLDEKSTGRKRDDINQIDVCYLWFTIF